MSHSATSTGPGRYTGKNVRCRSIVHSSCQIASRSVTRRPSTTGAIVSCRYACVTTLDRAASAVACPVTPASVLRRSTTTSQFIGLRPVRAASKSDSCRWHRQVSNFVTVILPLEDAILLERLGAAHARFDRLANRLFATSFFQCAAHDFLLDRARHHHNSVEVAEHEIAR